MHPSNQDDSENPSENITPWLPMGHSQFGRLLDGSLESIKQSYEKFQQIPVDSDVSDEVPEPIARKQQTIKSPIEVAAPGTFSKKNIRTIRAEPCVKEGWWLERSDLPGSLPIRVSSRNVWTTGEIVSNIVLRSGSQHNYVRLVEHIIALKAGMDVDNLIIKFESGDPPLFEKGSLELVEALSNVEKITLDRPVKYFTVKEKVSIVDPQGGFLIIEPCKDNDLSLRIDCARDFKNAIGQQRIRFVLNEKNFKYGADARTNTTAQRKLFCQTIGQIFADIRNLGYNEKNVLIAGKKKYVNKPRHMNNGKSLEAAWHRAILDLLAALALIEDGRFLGTITDYKGGHFLDVEMVKLLYAHDLLTEVQL